METLKKYFERKHAELRLINESLHEPIAFDVAQSIDEVVKLKFKLTAALRAENERSAWNTTETSWSHGAKSSGPFRFDYDYQRADLSVQGPSFYRIAGFKISELLYTGSGMAAISAVLLALSRIFREVSIFTLPGSYGETIEFLNNYGPKLQLHQSQESCADRPRPRVLLLDSCVPSATFSAALRENAPAIDLMVFDTTCFAGTSGRIRRALCWAHRRKVPVVMVRSHTKLDSMGAEYGRLGSLAFVAVEAVREAADFVNEMKTAIRLFGGAALPAHFPPYVGSEQFGRLTRSRIFATLRNNRLAASVLKTAFGSALDHWSGLYVTLTGNFDENAARQVVQRMSDDLRRKACRYDTPAALALISPRPSGPAIR
ncbi:hypothetical protein QRQ56_30795 [Bradyrhizobium sp. U531]|uniref:hypothetical protein n=1 Tax=Bradyrhizobium sp. U531 TaxID=3053458 RepID=UPI003F41DF7D